ncbi:MAG: hypothetical protein K5770_20025 [Lachnospiraceae bacterium]|nr:hypothetical protein [Lachnospiraceae bacterium]
MDLYALFDIPVGLSIISLISSALYFTAGLPVSTIRYIIFALFVISFCFSFQSINVHEYKCFAVLLLILLVMLVPGLKNQDQYYVWRGNIADQFGYITHSLALDEISATDYINGNAEMSCDLTEYGIKAAFEDRPGVNILFDIILHKGIGELFFHIYVFHCFLLALVFLRYMSLHYFFLDAETY